MSEIKTNKISSLNSSNSDITIEPDGTGDTIIASGKVGIGVTPDSELHIDRGQVNIRFGYNNLSENYIDADTQIFRSGGGSERLRILSGGGLTFNGDTAAANALDDYEEGSWTPTVAFGNNSAGQSYASRRVGKYTKVGRLVTVTFFVQLTNKGTSTGAMSVTGLPFTASSTDTPMFMGSVMFNGVSHAGYISPLIDTGASDIDFYETATSGARSEVGNTDVSNNDEIAATVTYFT